MLENDLIAKNNRGEIIKFGMGKYPDDKNLTEIISISNNTSYLHLYNNELKSLPEKLPKKLRMLFCFHNNIKQLPDLRNYKNLIDVCCDMCCFETYMVEMKNVKFQFYC